MTTETAFNVIWEAKDGSVQSSIFSGSTAARAEVFALLALRRRPEFARIVKVAA